jgi:hypothetical protein
MLKPMARPLWLTITGTSGACKQHAVFGHSHQGRLLPLRAKRRDGREHKGKKGHSGD